jgi:hypothetical protein
MLVREVAMFLGSLRVVLRVFVFAHRVVMLSLMMVMRGGMVMTGRGVMMLGRRMFRHLNVLPVLRLGSDRSSIIRQSPVG